MFQIAVSSAAQNELTDFLTFLFGGSMIYLIHIFCNEDVLLPSFM